MKMQNRWDGGLEGFLRHGVAMATLAVVLASSLVGSCSPAGDADAEVPASHAGEEIGGEGGHEAGRRVELMDVQRERIGLEIATARAGSIEVIRSFPAEVILNPDRFVHVVPRASGIVREVRKTVGDRVEPDEILAWIESAELAEAKLNLFNKLSVLGSRQIELPRAKSIFDNVNRLLALLETEPDEDELETLDGLEMGEYRGRLITAYADLTAARKTHDREHLLRSENISSEMDLIHADNEFERARAEYAAERDRARYEVLLAYAEAVFQHQVAEFDAVAAEQRLHLKGMEDDALAALHDLVPEATSLLPCTCEEPNCEHAIPSVLETLGKDHRFGWYPLKAPFGGVVTDKHLTLGEKIGSEESVFTIADTSSVWVRFNVYQKDLDAVGPGQEVRVRVGNGLLERIGTVANIAPIVEEETRTARARVVLDNVDGSLRPGLYATVELVSEVQGAVVVPKSATQVLDEEIVVFVEDGDGFLAVPVTLGRSDAEQLEVTGGLVPGQRYVNRGGFELKAKIVGSELGGHAGHGH